MGGGGVRQININVGFRVGGGMGVKVYVMDW